MPSDISPLVRAPSASQTSLVSAAPSTRRGAARSSSRGLLALNGVPPLLRPLVRAYLLGYASAVAPRLLTLILQHVSRRRLGRKKFRTASPPEGKQPPSFTESFLRILRTGLQLQRFPAFCAALVGGSTLLHIPLQRIVHQLPAARQLSLAARLRVSRWLSACISAWFSLQLLQSKGLSEPTSRRSGMPGPDGTSAGDDAPKLAGRTLDLTLFAATRAFDVIVGELWSQRRARRQATGTWTSTERIVSSLADPLTFVASCALIMWSWFYHPSRLPPSYNKWITSAASVDLRLIEALRRCHTGELRYGQDTGQAPLLGSMCQDYKLPYAWGDPQTAIPFPCELVHMGCGSSCEYHAVHRFVKSWKWSMLTYFPLALALQLRSQPRSSSSSSSRAKLVRAFTSGARSSAFLGMFITLFYYGVCLGRTRLGPRLIGKQTRHRQLIDGGVCVGTGCFLCGWSVLIETASRQKDMALFVAPRALATVVPRRYPLNKQWRETLVFAASTAVVFTCVLENPKRVRGVLGRVLNMVMVP